MWVEEFQDSKGNTKYRFYERYIDPVNGKRKRTSVVMHKNTRQSEKEAQKRLNDRIDDKIKSSKSYVPGADALTFHQLIDEWLDHYIRTSGSKRSTVLMKTSKVSTIKKGIADDILAKRMNSKVVQDFIDHLEAKNYNQKVIQTFFNIIQNVLKYGRKRYKLPDAVYLEDVVIAKKAPQREEMLAKRNNYLEMEQLYALVDAVNAIGKGKRNGYARHAYFMCAYIAEFQALNGMRIGELLAIQPDNIDFDNKKLVIDGTILWVREGSEYGFKDTTKTSASYRTISLTSRSIEILEKVILENKKLKQWEENYQDRGFLFVDYKGNPISKSTANRCLKAGAERIGLDKKVTTHTLRHTHISLLSQLGVSLKAIMERVGHSDHKTTLQIYSHVTEKMDKEMMEKLEKVGS